MLPSHPVESRSLPPCSHDGCFKPFLCSLILPTGRTNLCRTHYDRHFQQLADAANKARGLTDVSSMIAFCRALRNAPKRPPGNWWAQEVIDRFKAGKPTTIAALELAEKALSGQGKRVPGEDDE